MDLVVNLGETLLGLYWGTLLGVVNLGETLLGGVKKPKNRFLRTDQSNSKPI